MNAQQTAAANQRLMFTNNNNNNNNSDLSTSSNNPFRSDSENPSEHESTFRSPVSRPVLPLADDLFNDNTNMSTVSLSSKCLSFVWTE